MPIDQITIRGAREHNLKNVTLSIPRDKLVVFTGLSGSGKSSLAFDRSEEHTSELQSQSNLVCRLLLEKKKHHHHMISLILQRSAHPRDRHSFPTRRSSDLPK